MAKIKRIRRVNPDWKQPTASERSYRASLVSMTDDYIREVKASLDALDLDAGLRHDGIIDDIGALFAHFKAVANRLTNGPIASLPRIFSRVSSFNDKQWRRVIKVGTGMDYPASRDHSATGLGIDAYRAEPWLDRMQDAWVSNNTDLIKSLPDRMAGNIQQLVKNAVVNGTSADTLRDQIQKEYGTTRYRAELIAIDQIQKANAALAKQRQKDAGVTRYEWRGVLDARERATHKAREGKEYEWDDPPEDGHPGEPVRCRCHASPSWAGSIFDMAA